MRRTRFVSWVWMTFSVLTAACSTQSTEQGARWSLVIDSTDVSSVQYDIVCEGGATFTDEFEVVDDRDPPVWETFVGLPAGETCVVVLTAFDEAGNPICTGSTSIEIVDGQTVKADVTMECPTTGEIGTGNVEIDGSFEDLVVDVCPIIHILNAIPRVMTEPPGESSLRVQATDPETGADVDTVLSSTSGVIDDPTVKNTGFACTQPGPVEVTVKATGAPNCEQTATTTLVCPDDPCEGVDCSGGNELGIDDPGERVLLYDPQEGVEGNELPEGTETALPPDAEIQRLFGALETNGAEASLLFDQRHSGTFFNSRKTVRPADIVTVLAGQYVDVVVGDLTVRVANFPDSSVGPPRIVVPAEDLSTLNVLTSYSRGSDGVASLDMVSVFERANEAAGPIGLIDVSSEPAANEANDCEAQAWDVASEVPPIAVSFPPLSGCSFSECVQVKAAWIRANHDVWRVRQMLEYMDTKVEAQRSFLWNARAADFNNEQMGPETALSWYFGGFAQYRFEAIRWAYERLWNNMHDHDLEGLSLDFECHPGGGDICNTAKPPAHHAVKSNVKICSGFFEQEAWYQALLLVHEPLHHVFVPWNNNGPRLDPIQDTHTHGHGNLCLASLTTDKGYGLNALRHLATYEAGDGGTCFHRNFAFRNNDTYSYAAELIGSGVRDGEIKYWPWIKPNSPPSNSNPCDGQDFPNPGDGWNDPLNDCQKIGQELICPKGPGGNPGLLDLDIAMNCP